MGKGSAPRPFAVSNQEYANRWDAIWGRDQNKDSYAPIEETESLIKKDTRNAAEKKLDKMLEDRGAWEQGVDAYPILYKIAVELLERKK